MLDTEDTEKLRLQGTFFEAQQQQRLLSTWSATCVGCQNQTEGPRVQCQACTQPIHLTCGRGLCDETLSVFMINHFTAGVAGMCEECFSVKHLHLSAYTRQREKRLQMYDLLPVLPEFSAAISLWVILVSQGKVIARELLFTNTQQQHNNFPTASHVLTHLATHYTSSWPLGNELPMSIEYFKLWKKKLAYMWKVQKNKKQALSWEYPEAPNNSWCLFTLFAHFFDIYLEIHSESGTIYFGRQTAQKT